MTGSFSEYRFYILCFTFLIWIFIIYKKPVGSKVSILTRNDMEFDQLQDLLFFYYIFQT